jgi:hypothetical protein
VGPSDGTLTDGVAACCGTGMVGLVSGCDLCWATGEAWSLFSLAVIGVVDNADAVACSLRIRDVEANM